MEPEPLIDDGRVEAAKIVAVAQIAEHPLALLGEVLGPQGRIGAVLPAFDTLANDKRYAASAVVRAGTVLLDAPTKFRPDQHDRVIRGIVLAQVLEEGIDGAIHLFPQLRMHRHLRGVGIKAAVGGIENTRPQISEFGLGDTTQASSNG